jgi:N-acetylmuramoyl-L-alanine amidase
MIILAGHSNLVLPTGRYQDPGAIGHGLIEADLTHRLADLLAEYLPGCLVSRQMPARQEVNWLNSLTVPTQTPVISLHFNAFNGQATGTEVIYGPRANKNRAAELSALIANTLHLKDRGAKLPSQTAHGRIGVLSTKMTEAYLLEICFIDNAYDIGQYQRQESLLVARLANYLKNWQ